MDKGRSLSFLTGNSIFSQGLWNHNCVLTIKMEHLSFSAAKLFKVRREILEIEMNENPYKEMCCILFYHFSFLYLWEGVLVYLYCEREALWFQEISIRHLCGKSNGLTNILALCERKRKPIINRLVWCTKAKQNEKYMDTKKESGALFSFQPLVFWGHF